MPDNDVPDNNTTEQQPYLSLFRLTLLWLLCLFAIIVCVAAFLSHKFPAGPPVARTPFPAAD